MCKSSSRNFNRGATLAIVAVLALLMAPAAYGQFVQLSAGPIYTSPTVVGATNQPATFRITNQSSGAITIGNNLMRYVPACQASNYNVPGGCVTPETGIVPSATGTGQGVNPSCAQTWNISFINANDGFALTAVNPLQLAVAEVCDIAFTYNVTAQPAGGSTFGVGFAPAFLTADSGVTGTGSGSTPLVVQTCSAQVDKQVSCDGITWYDVGSAVGVTQGPICATGAPVQTRFFINNTGTAPISCTVTDNVLAIAGGVGVAVPGGGTSSALATVNPQTCNLTSGQSGDNTATLSSCSCPLPQGGTVPGTTGDPDSATYACAGVLIDKQISCDSGTTWADTGLVSNDQDGALGCIGSAGASTIKAQWYARSTGNVSLNCSLDDSNNVIQPAPVPVNPLAPSASATLVSGPTGALECMTAHGGGEPNTAALSCDPIITGGLVNTLGTLSVNDRADFECCGVEVDKQVSCNGEPWTDVGFAEDGINGCSAITPQPVAIQYFARNIGTTPATCSTSNQQGLTDINAGGILRPILANPINVGVIGTGATVGPFANTTTTACSAQLDTDEQLGNTATVNCTCIAPAGFGGDVTDADTDVARIQCGSPSFTSEKTCVPISEGSHTFTATVSVTNNGNTALSCTVVDTLYTGNGGACPPTAPTTPGPDLQPQPLTPGIGQTSNASAQFTTDVSVCNGAVVTCTAGGVTLPTQSPFAACPISEGGCFTRTPGYWGTHPAQAQMVLDQGAPGMAVCGITLTNTTAGQAGSTTEDMCGTGGPDFKPNNTSPQQLQLIRQCTAAALNLETSRNSNLNCDDAFGGSPNITTVFNQCCGAVSVCNGNSKPGVINSSDCISLLDAFNNASFPEGDDFPDWLVNSSAQPGQCQVANGNGYVNPGRNLGPAK